MLKFESKAVEALTAAATALKLAVDVHVAYTMHAMALANHASIVRHSESEDSLGAHFTRFAAISGATVLEACNEADAADAVDAN